MNRLFAVLCMLLPAAALAADPVVPLPRAHSHNDYWRDRPLLDALDRGFCSVEADVFCVDGVLLVGHDRDELEPGKTLETMYLKPLAARAREHGGRVYPGGPPVTLLVDIKDNAETTWACLREQLEEYRDMLTVFHKDRMETGAVSVILSGNRPIKTLAAASPRLAAIDGRPHDLMRGVDKHLMPLISTSWRSMFLWDGAGDMPKKYRGRLDAFIAKAHENGQRVRFWGLPNPERLWPLLYEAGVDLLNADQLGKLQAFLLEQRQETAKDSPAEN